jgi:sporulation protein YlmC with PRC-barrel domain
MTLKTITLSVAAASLLASGAIAQTSPSQDATPPAATETPAAPSGAMETPAAPNATTETPAAPSATMSDKTTMTDKSTGAMEYVTNIAADQMLASNVTGMSVINAAGEELGEINDLVVDQSGKPVVALIGVGGFLGIGEKDVGVPFDQLQFAMSEQNEQVARLDDATKETLEAAPSFVYTEGDTAAKTN